MSGLNLAWTRTASGAQTQTRGDAPAQTVAWARELGRGHVAALEEEDVRVQTP